MMRRASDARKTSASAVADATNPSFYVHRPGLEEAGLNAGRRYAAGPHKNYAALTDAPARRRGMRQAWHISALRSLDGPCSTRLEAIT